MILDFFNNILHRKIFLAAFLAWLIAQFVKSIISLVVNFISSRKSKNDSNEDDEDKRIGRDMMDSLFWKTGGMPSSHASMSTALTTSIGFEIGFSTDLFIVSFFFTTIIIRDATGVRLLAGKLARITNVLVGKYNEIVPEVQHMQALKVVEGHTLSEVFAGMMLGLFISIAIYLF